MPRKNQRPDTILAREKAKSSTGYVLVVKKTWAIVATFGNEDDAIRAAIRLEAPWYRNKYKIMYKGKSIF